MAIAPRQVAQPTIDGPLPICRGYQQLDSTALGVSSALTVPEGTSMVLLQAELVSVRYRADGVDPTGSVGMLLAAGGELLYPAGIEEIQRLRFIRTAPGATLNVAYY